MTTAKEIGNRGEEVAREFILSKGYEVLETNYRWRKFEIDLITKDKDTVVFIEVKLRSEK